MWVEDAVDIWVEEAGVVTVVIKDVLVVFTVVEVSGCVVEIVLFAASVVERVFDDDVELTGFVICVVDRPVVVVDGVPTDTSGDGEPSNSFVII